ncbi:putative pectinesterase/pectinesterase inhibitor 13 [Citrus sinensis]|uniref:probable pectinesterase/pectinesterase inhibitor 13 n=1 Tax=Citrus sinensis TaxID=2711 RepID=UPI0003D6F715|nr:probable pectinesterase/pectinesterase inhibitor 13 [Citrus sinensis]KAH9652941.1 putative pectinesterase/pectinesterase inhibitor 13 [Citrus sinensis]
MVFQDFDHLSERRKAERQRKFRKRVTISAISAFVLIILIAAGVFGVVSQDNGEDSSKTSPSSGDPKGISRAQKMISTICGSTAYKNSCSDTLSAAAEKDPSIDEPREFLKASIAATVVELDKAIKKVESNDFNAPETEAAFKVCKKVIDDAKEELNRCVSQVGGKKRDLGMLVERAGELNNWLSAVMTYQQTCIDGFPEGKMKSDMDKTLNETQQLTSNSLAMLSQFSKYLSSIMNLTPEGTDHRGLLDSKDGVLPSWMSHQERKMLQDEENNKIEPHLIVAKDGSGNFTTISEALAAVPQKYEGRFVIYVAAGIYEESVTVSKRIVNLTILGEGSQKSIIVGRKSVADGVNIYDTATFVAIGDGLFAKSMGFRNIAGPEKGKAVAARVQSDRATFHNCRFEGYQNAVWVQTHRQFYRSCLITGTVDFIFGDAAAIFQNCQIMVRKPLDGQENTVTAQSRIDKFQTTGIVLQNCEIAPDESLEPVKKSFRTYLGRPSKEYSRTIIMDSTLEDFIHPEGWLALKGNYGLKTLYYAEFNNKGPGASTKGRVKWPGYKTIVKEEAIKYTVRPFLQGDNWINKTGAPVHFGLF